MPGLSISSKTPGLNALSQAHPSHGQPVSSSGSFRLRMANIEVDVLFHDQSANVIRKAKECEAKKSAGLSRASERPGKRPKIFFYRKVEPTEAEESTLSEAAVDGGLTIRSTLEEKATCHFIFNYIVGINAPTRLQLDSLAYMYKYSHFDETLTTAVKAISFASYAHHQRSGDLAAASMYQYTRAISCVNAALQCPSVAVKDTTLLSIMILGMYEVITGINQRSIKAWMQHVRGSAALLKMRGIQQLDTPIGRRLFVQALSSILTTAIQLVVPIPKSIIRMAGRLRELIPPQEDYGQKAYDIQLGIIEANHYRYAVETGQISDPSQILSKALEVDARLAAVYESVSPDWRYTTIRIEHADVSLFYRGSYDLYNDLLTANLWNAMRVMRGLIHERIRDTLLTAFAARPPTFTQPEHTAQYQASTDMCYQLQAEILASVPQHLGYVKCSTTFSSDDISTKESSSVSSADSMGAPTPSIDHFISTEKSRFAAAIASICKNPSAPLGRLQFVEARANGGLNLMWPLFFAATREISTPEVKVYCIKNLRRIGDSMGIKQALVLAKVVESQTEIEAWAERPRVEPEDG